MTYDDELVKLYVQRGLARDARTPVRLPTECPRSRVCWRGIPPERFPGAAHPAAELSPPHVGVAYAASRLAILFENLREYGGFDFGPEATRGMRYLARCAAVGLSRGAKVLFRGGGYAGSRVWHQALSYAACWLRARGTIEFASSRPGVVPASAVADTLRHVALVQHVKCSPLGQRSEQSGAMWSECGRHVLAGELSVLRPTAILVVGTGENAAAVRSNILPHLEQRSAKDVRIGRRESSVTLERRSSVEMGSIELLIVPHPAAPGASSHALVEAVDSLLGSLPSTMARPGLNR